MQDLYDVFREARLNVKYYGRRLARLQQWNLGIEIAIALGTFGTLLSLPIFATAPGKILVIVFGSIGAFLGVLKPILNLPKKIERVSKLWSGYLSAFTTAQRLIRDVRIARGMDGEAERAARALHDQMDTLCAGDDPCPKTSQLKACEDEVNTEFPEDYFWYPPRAAT